MDVVVCGGGIVGLAAAYELAVRGADVTVCEKSSLGGGSTARAAGGIRSQFSTEVNVRLSLASRPVWDTFAGEFGVDIGLRKNGYLFLARDAATAERFRENVSIQQRLGAATELLTPAEVADRFPGVDPEPFLAATYNPDDGVADPNLAVQGYADAVRNAGANTKTGTAVTDVYRDGERVISVDIRANGETVREEVDYVVNAAGAWAARVGALAGVDLPIVPRRRQIAVVEPSTPVPGSMPLTIDLDTGSYFRPERDDVALVGGHFRAADPDADPEAFDEGLDINGRQRP